jgi:RHS repeat-associated protein
VATRHHFTGKERDAESGNDYFDARYYASSMGRFMSPDWSAKEEPVPYAKLDDPQSLNLYSYVRNNPLSQIDADGHWPTPWYGGTWTHSDIADAAYPGLSAAQRQIIKNGSANADKDQSRAGSPAHGMTPKGGSKEVAMKDAAKIVSDSEAAARNAQSAYTAAGGAGIADSALSALTPCIPRTDRRNISGARRFSRMGWHGGKECYTASARGRCRACTCGA